MNPNDPPIRVIGLAGKKGAGKNTVAAMLAPYGWDEIAFADPLKESAALIYGLSREQLHGKLKETPDPRWDGLTPREILQRLGTEVGRSIHPETWTRSLTARVQAKPDRRLVVTDVRFPNEAATVRKLGGVIFRVERTGFPTNVGADHASENETFEVDDVIPNNGAISSLTRVVANIVAKYHLGHGHDRS